MHSLSVLVVLSLVVCAAYCDVDPHHTICAKHECRPYVIVSTNEKYEVRKYHDAEVAGVNQKGKLQLYQLSRSCS